MQLNGLEGGPHRKWKICRPWKIKVFSLQLDGNKRQQEAAAPTNVSAQLIEIQPGAKTERRDSPRRVIVLK